MALRAMAKTHFPGKKQVFMLFHRVFLFCPAPFPNKPKRASGLCGAAGAA
jgi:hypothetical protein